MKYYFYKIDQSTVGYGDKGIFWCRYDETIETLKLKSWWNRYKHFKVVRRLD